ncbi:hypothetical protein Rumeso_04496 [Rubellimicrobium mesophilum DSM 19309]|uniref:Uncharacterized protein n=1 Tax=Rubellimicrobium mesophilum DSM 19309 TaxID=442562 RepID=A0A017HJD2_9RHOB|nr:hypothetical protein Rumeso_04496 [Rubellimicrobium mesophilum DSM 19309]
MFHMKHGEAPGLVLWADAPPALGAPAKGGRQCFCDGCVIV